MKRKPLYLLVITMLLIFTSTLIGCNLKSSKRALQITSDPYRIKQQKLQTLTFYFPGSPPSNYKEVINEIEARLRESLNIHLNFKWYNSEEYLEKVKTDIENGSGPDAFVLSKDEKQDQIEEMNKTGLLADLTPILHTAAPKLDELYSSEEKTNVTYNGKIVAIPVHFPKSDRFCAVIDTDAAKSQGVTRIVDPDTTNPNANDVKVQYNIKTDDDYLSSFGYFDIDTLQCKEATPYVHIGNHLVYRWDDPEMKLFPWEQTQEFRDAIRTIIAWKSKGYHISKSTTGKTGAAVELSPLETIRQGYDFKVRTNYGDMQEQIHLLADGTPEIEIFPLYEDRTYTRSTDIAALALNRRSPNIERVLQFLNWIQSSQENYDLFMCGIKTKNYVLSDNMLDFPIAVQKYFGWDGSSAFLNINYYRQKTSDPKDFKDAYQRDLDTGSKYQPSFGFRPDTTKLQAFLDRRESDFKNFDENLRDEKVHITSTDIDNFIQKQKDEEIHEIVSDIQKQLDLWKTENKK